MKSYALLLSGLLLFVMLFFAPITPNTVAAYTINYFRVTENNTVLYRTASDEKTIENMFFILPQSYFVQSLGAEGDFYKVNYAGVVGFVLKEEVIAVHGTPVTPFASATFKINGVASAVMRSSPSVSGGYVGLLPCDTEITFLGELEGEEALNGLGNRWFLARFISFEQGILTGYIYAPLTQELTVIPKNLEVLETSTPAGTEPEGIFSPELMKVENLLLIGVLSLGALILLMLLFKPHRRSKKEKKQLATQQQIGYAPKQQDENFDF